MKLFSSAICIAFLGACSSTHYLKSEGHESFRRKDYLKASEDFSKKAAEPGANQLLYILDEATSLFAARKYEEATKAFLRAEELAEIKDYTSVSEEVGSLVTSGNIRGYKGEDFEKVLINVYLALAFAVQGKIESAQVEARKINLLLHRLITEGKRNYQEAPFARYLSALMWDASGEWNSSYVDYKKTFELDPNFPNIGSDLIATARRQRFLDEERKWREQFPGAEERGDPKKTGEVVVIFEKGRSPIKVPRPEAANLPYYVSRSTEETGARVLVNGASQGDTKVFIDIENISYKWLEDRISRMRTANMASAALKGALAYGIGAASKNQDLGWIAFFALLATDDADLRSWLTLPQNIQLKRVSLSPGVYDIEVETMVGTSPIQKFSFPSVQVKAGKKVFFCVR